MSVDLDVTAAMRHFLLCNAMKAGPFSPHDALLKTISIKREMIAALRDEDVIKSVEDAARRDRYRKARWKFEEVDLAQCRVWNRMGGRHWASGTAISLLPQFEQREEKCSRIWAMVEMAPIFSEFLNILVIRDRGVLSVDDGSHRAIAMALAGFRISKALVGTI
jgi:hypothetical protein